MDEQKQRIAIAEWCGWKHRLATHNHPVERNGMRLPNSLGPDIEAFWKDNIGGVYGSPPDYLRDLNAMREARKSFDLKQVMKFSDHLKAIIQDEQCVESAVDARYLTLNATATQEAKAFLETIGKWEG